METFGEQFQAWCADQDDGTEARLLEAAGQNQRAALEYLRGLPLEDPDDCLYTLYQVMAKDPAIWRPLITQECTRVVGAMMAAPDYSDACFLLDAFTFWADAGAAANDVAACMVPGLGHDDASVRKAVIVALGEFVEEGAAGGCIEPLQRVLAGDADSGVRDEAWRVLAKAKALPEGYSPPLMDRLRRVLR